MRDVEARHPEHDAVAEAVASWYITSAPDLGYSVDRRPYGWVQWHRTHSIPSITLSPLVPDDVRDAIAQVRADLGGRYARLRVVGAEADARLRPALEAAGCQREDAEVYLAFTGSEPPPARPSAAHVEPVTADAVETWVTTKQRGFASIDAEPPPGSAALETEIRSTELAGGAHFWLARVGGEPAGALACYAGRDWLLFSLSTRAPFRRGGVARTLLAEALAAADAEGARSITINCDPEDWPQAWYRRLGFRDEVYWRATYELPAGA